MAVESPGFANQADTYNAEQTRRAVFASVFGQGTKQWTDFPVTPHAGLACNVGIGEAVVAGTSSPTQGYYYVLNSATISGLSFTAANATLPRIDAVVLTIDDSQYLGGADDAKVQILTGTASSGATLQNLTGAPSIPASSLLLAYVLIPATATTIVSNDIAQQTAQFQTLSGPGIQTFNLVAHTLGHGATFTTSGLTIPQPGLWVVTTNIFVGVTGGAGTPSAGNVTLQQNGSTVNGGVWSTAFVQAGGVGSIGNPLFFNCNAGDVLTLQYNNNNGGGGANMTFAQGAPNASNLLNAVWLGPKA